MTSTAVVTGATGFTGSHLVRRLVRDGRDVVATTRPTSDARALKEQGVRCLDVDLRDESDVREALGSVGPIDEVYHLAAAFRRQHADLTEFRKVNVDGARHVLSAAADAGARRIVHCSTVGVQGEIDDPPATEEYRAKPGDVYQATKLEGEEVALELADAGAPVSVVRPVGIYGPGDRRFLKLFRPIARGRMVMIGDGETLYHLTYVEDVVQGLVLAGSRPEAVGEVFTIAGARYTTLDELFELIAEAVGVPPPRWRVPYAPVHAASVVCDRICRLAGLDPPLYPRRVEFFAKDRAFDITKARGRLGYEPEVDLREGLAATARWYEEQGLL